MNTRPSLVECDANLIRVEYLDDAREAYYCCSQPREALRADFEADLWLLSHDEVNQHLAQDIGAAHGFHVQPRSLKEGLPDGDCQALVVDLDSVGSESLDLQRLMKELSRRQYRYPVVAFGYSVDDEQLLDLRAAGIQVIQYGLCPEVFAAIAEHSANAPSGVLVG
jgi:hypothetical protein